MNKYEIRRLRKNGATYQAIAGLVGCSRQYISQLCLGVKKRTRKLEKKTKEQKARDKLLSSIVIDQTTGCWEWQKSKSKEGYGRTCYLGKYIYAHRLSFLLENGYLPEEANILHSCDNRSCCNPDHLSEGTQAENIKQRDARKTKGFSILEQVKRF